MSKLHDFEVEELLEEVVEVEAHELLVFNDDVNTFEHVIETLVEVCEHSPEQAEQCTLIIHYKGKCVVKHGNLEDLLAMKRKICDRGIDAVVS